MQKSLVFFLATLSALFCGVASAALPTEATAAFTTLSGAATDVLAAIWPIIGVVLAGFVTIKLVKRGVSKI